MFHNKVTMEANEKRPQEVNMGKRADSSGRRYLGNHDSREEVTPEKPHSSERRNLNINVSVKHLKPIPSDS